VSAPRKRKPTGVPADAARMRQVAALYTSALAAGSRGPVAEAAAALGITRASASWYVKQAREAGLVEPLSQVTGKPVPPPPQPLAARYLSWCEQLGLSAGTVYARRRALIRLAAWLPVPLAEASAEHLAEWRAQLDMTPDAVVNNVSMVRGFYVWLLEEGIRPDNPARRLPVPRRRRRIPRPIAEDDLMAALDGAPRQVRLWLVLAGWVGLRACEIAGLRRENVLDKAVPPVVLVAEDTTKGTKERTIPLSPFALAELVDVYGLPDSGWVSPRLDGRPGPNKPHRVSQICWEWLNEHGNGAVLHQLRHRMLTMTWRASKDLLLVQELAGHADPRTTQQYVAYDAPGAAAAVAALPVPPQMAGWPG
jgi:integrase